MRILTSIESVFGWRWLVFCKVMRRKLCFVYVLLCRKLIFNTTTRFNSMVFLSILSIFVIWIMLFLFLETRKKTRNAFKKILASTTNHNIIGRLRRSWKSHKTCGNHKCNNKKPTPKASNMFTSIITNMA